MGFTGAGEGKVGNAGAASQQEVMLGEMCCQRLQHVAVVALYSFGLIRAHTVVLADILAKTLVHHGADAYQLLQFFA